MSNITKSLTLPVLFAGFLAYAPITAQTQDAALAVVTAKRAETQKVVVLVDELARFPGCENAGVTAAEKSQCAEVALEKFIEENLKYPEVARNDDFRPRLVRIEIMVEPDGRIHSPRIMEPGIKEYDQQAQAVFVEMGQKGIKWTPAKFEGQAVRAPVTTSVRFDWKGRNKAFPTSNYSEDVFELVDEVPAFATCQQTHKKDEQIRDCALEYIDDFFQRNMNYPAEAMLLGLEGDIRVQFVVGKDGIVRDVKLKNDIGLGCGDEAKRLFELMNEKKIGWIPGEEDGQKVNVVMETVVHFKIKPSQRPAAKLALVNAKSVFVTERAGYEDFLNSYLKFPQAEGINPCSAGVIDVQFKVNAQSNDVEITSMVDYNNLGKDFKTAVTDFLNETEGEWNVNFPNLSPETKYYLSIPIAPASETCADVPKGYKEMIYKAIDGATLTEKKATLNDGLDLLDKAVRIYPADNKIRHLRGMALYNNGRQVEGCVDLSFVNKQNKDISVPKTCR